MKVEVEVRCGNCGTEDDKMEGADEMYENPITKTQSREYTCSDCGNSVYVTLIPKKD